MTRDCLHTGSRSFLSVSFHHNTPTIAALWGCSLYPQGSQWDVSMLLTFKRKGRRGWEINKITLSLGLCIWLRSCSLRCVYWQITEGEFFFSPEGIPYGYSENGAFPLAVRECTCTHALLNFSKPALERTSFLHLPSLEQTFGTQHILKIIFYLLRKVIGCSSRSTCQGSETKTTPLFWWICSVLLNTMWRKLMNEAQVSLGGFSKSVHQKSQHIPSSFKRGCWWAYFKANNTAALTNQLYYLTVPTGT